LALPATNEDVNPSFHHGQVITMMSDNDDSNTPRQCRRHLVIGKFGNHHQTSIPLDPLMGHVFFVDVQFQDNNSCFEECIGNDGPIEVGIYVSEGSVSVDDVGNQDDSISISEGSILVMQIDRPNKTLQIKSTSTDTRIAIIGGTPLPEKRHVFWNFVSSSEEKIEIAADAWNRLDRNIFPLVVNESNEDSIPLPVPYRRPKRS
jgi:redox-sensitive bicupin YhaK (pirin superfamily)